MNNSAVVTSALARALTELTIVAERCQKLADGKPDGKPFSADYYRLAAAAMADNVNLTLYQIECEFDANPAAMPPDDDFIEFLKEAP